MEEEERNACDNLVGSNILVLLIVTLTSDVTACKGCNGRERLITVKIYPSPFIPYKERFQASWNDSKFEPADINILFHSREIFYEFIAL
jgi:hypothetical protein